MQGVLCAHMPPSSWPEHHPPNLRPCKKNNNAHLVPVQSLKMLGVFLRGGCFGSIERWYLSSLSLSPLARCDASANTKLVFLLIQPVSHTGRGLDKEIVMVRAGVSCHCEHRARGRKCSVHLSFFFTSFAVFSSSSSFFLRVSEASGVLCSSRETTGMFVCFFCFHGVETNEFDLKSEPRRSSEHPHSPPPPPGSIDNPSVSVTCAACYHIRQQYDSPPPPSPTSLLLADLLCGKS